MRSLRRLQSVVTLKELLVVCAILIVLMLFLFPTYHVPREKAVQATCSSNMKQIGLGLIQYAQDNNNELPNGTQPTPGLGWAGQIYPYAKSVQLFRCPDDTPIDTAESASQTTGSVSYAYNSNIPRWFSRQKKPTNGLPNPAQIVELFEVTGTAIQMTAPDEGAAQGATMFSAAGDGTASRLHSRMRGPDHIHYATGDIGGRPCGTISQFNAGRHQGGSNFLLADGHVKWFKPGQISTGTDAPTPNAVQTGGVTGTAAGTGNPNYAATFSVK